MANVKRQRTFAAIGQRHRQVDSALAGADPLGHQSAIRIALQRLDMNDVGAPVCEQRARDGNEDPLGQLDDANAFKSVLLHSVFRNHQLSHPWPR
jgi:hypothetical protein